MTQLNPSRFPVLTDAIEADPGTLPAVPADVLVLGDACVPRDTPHPGAENATALGRQMRDQVRLAVERLQEELRAEVSHRMDLELEARVAALLASRLDRLAAELADALRPVMLDVVRQAVTDVLEPGAGNS